MLQVKMLSSFEFFRLPKTSCCRTRPALASLSSTLSPTFSPESKRSLSSSRASTDSGAKVKWELKAPSNQDPIPTPIFEIVSFNHFQPFLQWRHQTTPVWPLKNFSWISPEENLESSLPSGSKRQWQYLCDQWKYVTSVLINLYLASICNIYAQQQSTNF